MLQKAQYAADLIDVSFETFTGSISKMETKLRTNEEGFNALGIATRGANDEMLSTEDIFSMQPKLFPTSKTKPNATLRHRSSSENLQPSLRASSMTEALPSRT